MNTGTTRRVIKRTVTPFVYITSLGRIDAALDDGTLEAICIGSQIYIDVDELMEKLAPKVRFFAQLPDNHPAIMRWPDDFDVPTKRRDLFSAA